MAIQYDAPATSTPLWHLVFSGKPFGHSAAVGAALCADAELPAFGVDAQALNKAALRTARALMFIVNSGDVEGHVRCVRSVTPPQFYVRRFRSHRASPRSPGETRGGS